MDIFIRDMNKLDWTEVSEIYEEGIKTNLATFTTKVPSYKDWDKSHLSKYRFVATIHDVVVGWCALSPISNRCVYGGVAEVSVYVHVGHSGKGVGFLLLSHLIKSFEEDSSMWTLQSHVMENNVSSLNLHKKCGFRIVGTREKFGCDVNGDWRNVILLEKRKFFDMSK